MPGLVLSTLAKAAIPAVAIGVIHVPIFMHVMGNLFSIWQSLGGEGMG